MECASRLRDSATDPHGKQKPTNTLGRFFTLGVRRVMEDNESKKGTIFAFSSQEEGC